MQYNHAQAYATREELNDCDEIYSVYAMSADRFNCITLTCQVKATTKEKAVALCSKRNENMNRKCGQRVKYFAIHTDKELAKLKAHVEKVNAVNIPIREKHWNAVHAEMKRVANIREKENSRLFAEGFHYDNQQRVNEYKGTMRG